MNHGSETPWLKGPSRGHFGFRRGNVSFTLWASGHLISTFFQLLQLFEHLDFVIFKILNSLENSLRYPDTFLKVTSSEKKEKKCTRYNQNDNSHIHLNAMLNRNLSMSINL